MAYVLIRGARNTLAVRRPRAVRGLRGWGLGQECGDVGEPDCPPDTPIITQSGPTTTLSLTPAAPLNTSSLLSPSSPTNVGTVSPNQVVGTYQLGSSVGCPAGQVTIDPINGVCGPPAQLVSTLSSSTGAASVGLTPQQAAAAITALNAGQSIASILGGTPSGGAVVPVSTNPFASISPTMWAVFAAVAVGIVLISQSKR
jgi:hypothetical protein